VAARVRDAGQMLPMASSDSVDHGVAGPRGQGPLPTSRPCSPLGDTPSRSLSPVHPMWRGHLAGQASIRQATRALSGTAPTTATKRTSIASLVFSFLQSPPTFPLCHAPAGRASSSVNRTASNSQGRAQIRGRFLPGWCLVEASSQTMCRIFGRWSRAWHVGTARRRAPSRIPEDAGTAAAGGSRARLSNLLPLGARNHETPARLRRGWCVRD